MEYFPIRSEDASFVGSATLHPCSSFAEAKLVSHRLSDSVFMPAPEGDECTILLDRNGLVLAINAKAAEAVEISSTTAFLHRPLVMLWPADMRPRVAAAIEAARNGTIGQFTGCCPTALGSERWWDVVVSARVAEADGEQRLAVVFTDTTARRQTTKKLRWLTTHDDLTGLPNRHLFLELFNQQLEVAQSEHRSLALVMFNIVGLKEVNRIAGRTCADALLRTFAARLNGIVGDRNIAARLGGDKFAVVLGGHTGYVGEAIALLLTRVCAPFRYETHKLDCSVRVGVSLFPHHGGSALELLRSADAALDVAKEDSSNPIQYAPSITDAIAHENASNAGGANENSG